MELKAVIMMITTVGSFILLNSKSCGSYGRSIHCITSDGHYRNSSNEICLHGQNVWLWSNINENFAEYFVSNRKIYFLPGEYKLNNHLMIINVTNLTLIGFGNVSMQCTPDAAAVVSIYNSTFVKLENVKLINCGMPINNLSYYNVSLSTVTMAALFAYKVESIAVINVTFEDSQGHAIFGLNALKDILIENVIIKNTMSLQETVKENKIRGIVFIYNDYIELKNKDQWHDVLIKNCNFTNLRNMNKSLPALDSVVIGMTFNQTEYDVKVTIQDSNIENIISKGLPLISLSYVPFTQTIVNFTNTKFINNSIISMKGYSLFTVNYNNMVNKSLPTNRFLHIIIYICEFRKNRLSIWNDKINKHKALKVMLMLNKFINNSAVKNTQKLWILNFRYFADLTIQDCHFASNMNSTLAFSHVKNLRFLGRNVFEHNFAVRYLLYFDEAYPQFGGSCEFSYNVANSILSVYRNITLLQNTMINIFNNKVASDIYKTDKMRKLHWAPIHVGTRDTLFQCSFQFDVEAYRTANISVSMINNTYYSHAVFGTQMNSCYWRRNATDNVTPGEAYTNIFLHNQSLTPYVNREGAMLCYCKNNSHQDCFKDRFQQIFPGQVTNISLILLPLTKQTALYVDSSSLINNSLYSPCEVPSSKIHLISNKCTTLSFKIKFKSLEERSCSFYLKTAGTPVTLFIFYFDHKECPNGFQFVNGLCDCHPQLKAAFPSLICDIDKQVLIRPPDGWIGISSIAGNDTLYYVEKCIKFFCSWRPSILQLHLPDTQCVNNRIGIMCGHCPPGLDSMFGSFACKKCSNYWLFLLPVFMVAGILLVLSLFLINVTVVHGNINGFILYANVLVGNNYSSFPKSSVIFVLISLLNLDLGIETCFYHGMTEYDKTWLQFAFPAYLLLIVATLAFTSRYSSLVERLTRRRVIPVIATIFLLSYSKLLLTTTKVLFSYKTVHRLDGHTTIIWMWDSSVPLIGVRFIFLFAACLAVFLMVLVPFNLIMLFTKLFYRLNFFVKYIRPYVDACQAPFKDKFRFSFGLELVMRSIYFTLGNRILNGYQTVSLSMLASTLFLVYLCIFQPFKSTANNILYISYAINAQFINIIIIFNNLMVTTSYNVIFNGLVLIAFLEFVVTILCCFYINNFKKISKNKNFIENIIKFITKHLPVVSNTGSNMAPLSNEDALQEELLMVE